MIHPITKTENYLLVVDESEIKEDDWIFNSHKVEFASQICKMPPHPIEGEWWDEEELSTTKKIIAHLPLNNAPILEGVPLLPPLEDEVEKLEMEYFIELEKRREVAKNFTGQVAGRHPDAFSHSEMIYMNRGYIEGYNKAKKKYHKAKYPVAFDTGHFRNTITNSQGIIQVVGNYIYDEIISH